MKRTKKAKKTIEMADESLGAKLLTLSAKIREAKALEEQIDELKGEVREYADALFIQTLITEQKNPEQIVVSTSDGGTFTYSVTPKKEVTKEQAEVLRSLDRSLIEEKTTYTFDTALLEKYRPILAKRMSELEEIPASDRRKLIKAEKQFMLDNNAIEKVYKICGNDIEQAKEVLGKIKPTCTLKNIKHI